MRPFKSIIIMPEPFAVAKHGSWLQSSRAVVVVVVVVARRCVAIVTVCATLQRLYTDAPSISYLQFRSFASPCLLHLG